MFLKGRCPLEHRYLREWLRSSFLLLVLLLLALSGCRKGELQERVDRLISKQKLKEAERILLESDTTKDLFHILMGDLYLARNKFIQALSQYEIGSIQVSGGLKERLIRGLILLGRKSQKKGYIYIAERAFKRVLELDPTYPLGDGFLLLGNLTFREHKYDTAFLFYKKYLSMGGMKRLVLVPYAISLFKLGLYDQVISLMPRGPKIPSADLILVYDMSLYREARLLIERDRTDSAIVLLRKIPREPGPGVVLADSIAFLLGEAYEKRGDTVQALLQYEKIALGKRYTRLREMALLKIRSLTLR